MRTEHGPRTKTFDYAIRRNYAVSIDGENSMPVPAPYLIALGRVLMAVMFIQSGIEKIFGYSGAEQYMEAHGVPSLLLPLVIIVEAGGGLCVLLGLFTRWAVIALGGFCLLAAILFHYQPSDTMQMINFMKNITIAGGFLVLAGAGPGALALDNRR
jgi:putative oxidoreductase